MIIQGYPDESSAFPGDTIHIHVSTDAPAFRIDFYRQGATLDFVLSTGWMQGVFAEDHDPDQDWGVSAVRRDGVQADAWAVYPFTIPGDWGTGAYIAMLTMGDGAGNPVAPLPVATTADARAGKALIVVKNPAPGLDARVLYKLPLFTYQMYNAQGGNGGDPNVIGNAAGGSGYQGFWVTMRRPGGGTGGTPWDVQARFFPTPNLDPFDMASPRQTFAHWDAKMIAWLEREGVAVDYCTDLDVHLDDGSTLSRYALVLSVGHDEYFSTEMRDRLEAFVAAGGNIACFSGNTCYWRLVFPVAGSLKQITRDYLWADPNGPDRPEDSLTGVGFRNGGERNFPVPQSNAEKAGYVVQHTGLWPFEHTGLGDGQTIGKDRSIVGYECDGTPYANVSPGLVAPKFTPTDHTPPGFVILGTGVIPQNWLGTGQAATMGMYTAPGTVFTGATTDWPRALAEGDRSFAQITRNVLARLGGGPFGATEIWRTKSPIAIDGFYTDDDRFRHALVATTTGDITEVYFDPGTGVGTASLGTFAGVMDVAGFFSPDDGYRHAIVLTAAGDLTEIYFSPKSGIFQAGLGRFPGAVAVSAFFTDDDNYRHAIVGSADGELTEVYWSPQAGIFTAALGRFPGIVDVAGFFSTDDGYRHAIVGTRDGRLTEVYFKPQAGAFQADLGAFPGVRRVAAFYDRDDRHFRRRVIVAHGTRVTELKYDANAGAIRALLSSGPILDVGGFYSPDDRREHALLLFRHGSVRECYYRS